MVQYWECKYCDSGIQRVTQEGEIFYAGCDAEWRIAKILVEIDDDEYDDE